jgi:hypothetical protein
MFADQKARQRLGRRPIEQKFKSTSTQGSGPLKIDLALTLFEAGVLLVDNVELTVATDDFAINATFLHRGFYFHDLEKNEKLLVTILDATLRQIVR